VGTFKPWLPIFVFSLAMHFWLSRPRPSSYRRFKHLGIIEDLLIYYNRQKIYNQFCRVPVVAVLVGGEVFYYRVSFGSFMPTLVLPIYWFSIMNNKIYTQ
jgi:hypothetical protein